MENVLRSAHLVPTKSRIEAKDGSRVVFYVVFYVNAHVSTTHYTM